MRAYAVRLLRLRRIEFSVHTSDCDVIYYVALPFVLADDGVAAGEAVECLSANAAVMRAEALSRKPGCAGAVAFSRTGDPSTGDFGDAKLIRKFGDVPDDLNAL
jgi:hypothetical protein